MADLRFTIEARWDPEARVYWAVCPEIPGFVTEAQSFDALVARALDLIPEMVELHDPAEVVVTLPVPRTERLPTVA